VPRGMCRSHLTRLPTGVLQPRAAGLDVSATLAVSVAATAPIRL
jgi:hypothetical protein